MSDTSPTDPRPTRDDRLAPVSRLMNGTRGRKNRFVFIVAIAAIVIAGVIFITRGSTVPTVSKVGSVPTLAHDQGAKPVSPEYAAALKKSDEQRVELAESTPNTSAMPTIVAPGSTPTPLPVQQTAPQAITPYTPPVTPVSPVVNSGNGLSFTQQQQPNNTADTSSVSTFMAGLTPQVVPAQIEEVESHPATSQPEAAPVAQPSAQTTTTSNPPSGPFSEPAAGTILYSQLLGRADSDDPGPVIAEILQGPLTGARLIGSFSAGRDGLIIKFTTMTVPYKDSNGIEQTQTLSINAVAVDQDHLGDAMATYVNNHILARLALSFATSFAQGFGQALESSGATTVETGTGAIATSNPTLSTKQELEVAGGQAAGNAGSIINQIYGNLPTTIIVDANTPFGLLFLGQSNGN